MSPALGILFKLASALAFTLMSAGIRYKSQTFPVAELVFFRSFFALIPVMIWLKWRGDIAGALRTKSLKVHVKRGIIGSTGMFLGFLTLSMLPLSDAVALGYATPLMVVVLASVVLKEKVRVYRWSAIIIGFAGVIVMLSPHLELGGGKAAAYSGSMLGVGLGLAAAACSATATIEVRSLTRFESTGAIVFYFMSWCSILGLVASLPVWVTPTMADAAWLICIGITGGLGQILLTESYRHGDASLIAPFEYSTMLWAVILGWFLFDEWPASAVFIGAGVVILSGIYVIWREHSLGLLRPEKEALGSSQRLT